jgi:endonuclease/exonuclease/phosphatase family metal-dependent hydrolase
MVRLIASGEPDVVCLQELPAWGLGRLPGWSGMQACSDVAQPPHLGPVPITAALGRSITSLNNGLLRSAVAGQANAILLNSTAQAVTHQQLVLNGREFRAAQSEWLSLSPVARLAWPKERRIVQVVRVRLAGQKSVLVANLHATSFPADQRLADAELLRAAVFADGLAEPGDIVVLAGDFNIPAARSATQAELSGEEWGFSPPHAEGIDQILVRGASVESLERWPTERRRVDGRILSDHTPVEARVA